MLFAMGGGGVCHKRYVTKVFFMDFVLWFSTGILYFIICIVYFLIISVNSIVVFPLCKSTRNKFFSHESIGEIF